MLLNNAMNYPKPQVIAFDSTDSGTPQQMFCNICYKDRLWQQITQ
jgi:hypothetical protein